MYYNTGAQLILRVLMFDINFCRLAYNTKFCTCYQYRRTLEIFFVMVPGTISAYKSQNLVLAKHEFKAKIVPANNYHL